MSRDTAIMKNLRRIMYDKGLSQADLARALDINKATVSSWMNGTRIPRLHKIDSIAEILGVNREDIVGKELKEPSEEKPYYLNEETAKIAQEAYDNPELRMLFDASRNSRPEDIRLAIEMLKRFKETNLDG